MKLCPECGIEMDFGSAKFCHNCGTSLSDQVKSDINNGKDQSFTFDSTIYHDVVAEKDESKTREEPYANSIYSLGIKLEEVVEKILIGKEYSTQKRLKLMGRSGALHEIDVLAKKRNQSLAVECKNYDKSTVVGIKEIRDFHSKLNDLKHYGDSLFVTYGKFSSDSTTYANKYDIELWDGEILSKIHLSMLVGRYTSSKDLKVITLESALPIDMTYEEISQIYLENSKIAEITGILLFRPYYVFDYKVDSLKMDKNGKVHRVHSEGKYILDAITEFFLQDSGEVKTPTNDQTLFSKRSKEDPKQEDLVKNIENNNIFRQLNDIQPKTYYRIKENPDYSIEVLEPTLSSKTASYITFEKIIESNIKEISYEFKTTKGVKEQKSITIVPKKSDITIKKSSLVYVPIWFIDILSKSITYKRRALAATKTVIMDELSICPKDFSAVKIWMKKKTVHAFCETCGLALCEDHIGGKGDKYYCKEHA